ncbi:RNA methyltransferase [Corynebacterium sp. zg-331]|uniref:TrmH family RNA methyltransferase n=1 Tax=unclassified Corynebacterium TaxID=2624378 RepID=UPI00128DEBD3|nr:MULTISPECIES: RNA methyltransferase [unclassified Corynebacterium]MBC3186898.1 RNA methyltransferase [Corynebacterium sp. zg-331]MPV53378.1 RNA methyltransferase [Corynebacterium sp. zg331]
MPLDFSAPFTERTPRIVAAAKLHRPAARRKVRAFLVEGENAVEAAVTTGSATDVYVTERAAHRCAEIVKSAQYLNVYVHPISDKAARSLTDMVTPTGIFAVCSPVLWPMRRALASSPRLVSVPVATADPGNAGTLIRVSDAVGADAVVFAGETVDPQGAKVVRASAGSLFHLPVVREPMVEAVLDSLRDRGLQILATAADGEVDLDHAEDLLAAPTAWLFGNEAHGLGKELLAQADHRVRIPLRGRAESLNLATAASICLYESARAQARAAGYTELVNLEEKAERVHGG